MNLHIQTVLVLLLQLPQTHSSGVLTVRLGEFKNPSGRTYDGTCCDPLADEDKSCTDQCDYVMRLIVTGLGRANDHVFLFHRPIKYDSNNIEFEHSDNNLLLTVLFDRWPEDGLVKMNAFFYDYDDFDHTTTLVDWFETDLKQSNSTTSPSTAVWGQFQEQTVVGNRQLDKTLLTFDWSIMEPDDEIDQSSQNENTRETKQIEYFTTRASGIKEKILSQQSAATSSHFNPSENTAFYEKNYYLTNNDEILPADYNDVQSYREDTRKKLGNENANNIDVSKENKIEESSLLDKLEKVKPLLNTGDNLIETQYGVEDSLEKTEADYSQNEVSLDLLQHSDKTKNYKQNYISTNTPKQSSQAEYDATSISRPKSSQHSTTYLGSSFDQSMQSEVKDVAASNNNASNKFGSLISSGINMKAPPSDGDAVMLKTFSNYINNEMSIGDIELSTKGLAGASQNSYSLLGNHSNQSNSTLALKAEEAQPMVVFHPRVPYGFITGYPQVTDIQAQFPHGNFSHDAITTTKISHLVDTMPLTSEPNPVYSLSGEDKSPRKTLNHPQNEHSKQEDMLIKDKQIIYPSGVNGEINKSSVAEDKKQTNVTMETYMANITSLSRLKILDTIEDDTKEMTDSNINNTESIRNTNSHKTWYNAKKFQKSNGELLHHSIQLLKSVKFQTAAPVMWFVTAQRPDSLSENQRYEIVYRTSETSPTALALETDSGKSKENSTKQDALDKNNVFNYAYGNVYSQQSIINEVINLTKSTIEILEEKKSTSPSYLKSKKKSIQINSLIASPKGPHINITQPLFSQEHFPNLFYNIYVPVSPSIGSINSSLPFTIHSPEKLNSTNKFQKPNIKIEFQKSQHETRADNGHTLTEINENKNNKLTGSDNLSVLDPALKKEEKQENSLLEPTKDSQFFVSDKVQFSSKLDEKNKMGVKANNSGHVDSKRAEAVLSYNIPDNISPMETVTKNLVESNINTKKIYNDLNLEYKITDDKSKNITIETNGVEETPVKEKINHDMTENEKKKRKTLTSMVTFDGEDVKKNGGIDTKNGLDTIFHDSMKSTVPQVATTNVYLQFLMSTDSPNSRFSSNNNVNQFNANKEKKPVSRNGKVHVNTTTVTATGGLENIESTKTYNEVKGPIKSGQVSESNEDVTLLNQDKSDANSLPRYDEILKKVILSENGKLIRADVLTTTMVTWPERHQESSTVNVENNNDVIQQFDINSKTIKQHHNNLESANYVRKVDLNKINMNKNTHTTAQAQQEDGNSRHNKYLIPEKHPDIQTTRRKLDLSIYPLIGEHQSSDTRMEFSEHRDKMEANVLKEKSLLQPTPTRNQENAANSIDNMETLTQILHPHQKLPSFDNKDVTLNSRHVTDKQDIEYTSTGVSTNTNNIPKNDGIYNTFQPFHDNQGDTESLAGTQRFSITPPAPNDAANNVADPFDLMSLFRANIKLLETPTADQDNIKVANSSELSIVKDRNSQTPLLSEVAMQSKQENDVLEKKYYNEADDKMASDDSLIELNNNNRKIIKVSSTFQNKQFVQNTQNPTKLEFALTNQDKEFEEYKVTTYETVQKEETMQSLSQKEWEQQTQKLTFNDRQDQATDHLTELNKSDKQTIQNSALLNESRKRPGLAVAENKPEIRPTQKLVIQPESDERATKTLVKHTKSEDRTTQKPVEQTKSEKRTVQKPIEQTKSEERITQKPIEQTKSEERTTQRPVGQTKSEERTPQKPVEQTKPEERTTQKPDEQFKEGTTQIPVDSSKTDEQTTQKSTEHNERNENTTRKSLAYSKPGDRKTLKPAEQYKAEYTTLKSIENNEQELTIQPVETSTLPSNNEAIQTNDMLLETISTVPEILQSVEMKINDKTPTTIKSYQLVNSRNLKSNSLPGILQPVLYVPPTEQMSKLTLEVQIPKQTLNMEMKTLPENGFKLHAIVQNTASVRYQPLQNLPTLKLSEAKTGTKRANVQNNINLDKLRNYMQVIRYRPTIQVPDRGLYTPQGEEVKSTETSAPLLPKSVERYGTQYQPLVGVSTVFTRYWPAVLGVTIGTMFLLTALITSILCRQRRLLIQTARWLDSPQHLSEPPDPSEYATSSATSLTSDLTRSSMNLMGSRNGSR